MNMTLMKRGGGVVGWVGGSGSGFLLFPYYRHVDDGHKVSAAASSLFPHAKPEKISDASNSTDTNKLNPIGTASY